MAYSALQNASYDFNFPPSDILDASQGYSTTSASPDPFPTTPEGSFGDQQLDEEFNINYNIDPVLIETAEETIVAGDQDWQKFINTMPADVIKDATKLRSTSTYPPSDTPTSLYHPSPSIARGRGYDDSRQLPVTHSDEEADAEGEEDDTDGDYAPEPEVKAFVGKRKRVMEDEDDEYRPISKTPTKRPRTPAVRKPKKGGPKSRGAYSRASKASAPKASSPTSSQSVGENPDSETSNGNSDARNQQSTGSMRVRLEKAVLEGDGVTEMNFLCPQCLYRPKDKRLPDFKRHLATHVAHLSKTCCAGVLIEDAAAFDIPEMAELVFYNGKYRIGGCMRHFSRMDALRRHLDNGNLGCVGYRSEHGRRGRS